MRIRILILSVMSLPLWLRAQPPTQPARPPVVLTRADLAEAYVRVQRTLAQHPPRPEDRARVHRAMDTAAYYFFAANHSAAIRTMNELCDSLRGAEQPDLQSFLQSLKIRVSPMIAQKYRPSIFNVRFTPMYDAPRTEPVDLRLVVRHDEPDGKIVFEQPIQFRPDAAMPSIATKQPPAAPGRYRVLLIAADGQEFEIGRWFVVEKSLDTLRVANQKRLSDLDTRDPRIFQAWAACLSRNALLIDRPSEDELAQYLADPVQLLSEVESEVQALRRGEDPYVVRIGEYYRSIPAGKSYIPARVYAPAAVKQNKPLPLVIALHGAGADEAIFMQGYGAGKIKKLADEHGFIVVAPSTYWVMPNPSALEGIASVIGADYSIDKSRVYVVGHSLGAMAAAAMAARHPKDLAGAVLIAGGKIDTNDSICPVLMIAAEHDPLMRADKLQQIADAARSARQPVEFRLIDDAGHVLVCDEVLDEAVEWLLAHQRPLAP